MGKLLLTDWKVEPAKIADMAADEMEELVAWFTNNGMGMKTESYQGEDLQKFTKVRDAMMNWRAQGSSILSEEFINVDVNAIEAALDRWDKIKDSKEFGAEDESIVKQLENVFLNFSNPRTGKNASHEEVLDLMRDKESIKDIRETIKKWTRLGRKIDMIDMPAIKNPEDRRKMKALFSSLVIWRRSKAFTDISGEEEAVAKDIESGMLWWKKKDGKKFNVQSASEELAPKIDAVRNVERCLGWLHDPDREKD